MNVSANLSIIIAIWVVIVISFPASSQSAHYASAQTTEHHKPLLEFMSKQKDASPSLENTTLTQGASATVSIVAVPTSGYEIQAVNLEVRNVPQDVYAWIVWNSFPVFDFDNNGDDRAIVSDYELRVYVDSNAAQGQYDLQIVGANGVAKNLATSEDVQMMNETFGSLHLSVTPSPSAIKMHIGEPQYQSKELCVEDDISPGGGTMCIQFIAAEEFPITISASSASNGSDHNEIIHLSVSGIPEGVWARILPANLTLRSDGSGKETAVYGKLKLAGAVRPFVGYPPDTIVPLVQANYASNSTPAATNFLPIVRTLNMTILHAVGKISFPIEITQNINGTNFGYAGVVYDPYIGNISSSLPVRLSIAGITTEDGGKTITPLPDWIKADIPSPSFTVNSAEPFYFLVKLTTHLAPVGTYYLAIDELVGEKHFTGHVKVDVIPPEYFSPALPPPGPPAAEYPVLSKVDSYVKSPLQLQIVNSTATDQIPIEFSVHNRNNYSLYDVEIGQFSTAVTGFTLENASRIETLAANETELIHGILTSSRQQQSMNGTANQSHLFWTIVAENDSGNKMESTLFERQMDIVAVPEFGSTVSLVIASLAAGITTVAKRFRNRR